MKALVLEDDDKIRRLIKLVLEKNKWTVFEANDGLQALKTIEAEGDIDLAILDIWVPTIDGLTVNSYIKQYRPLIKTIILTAKTDEETEVKSLEAGADVYLRKPLRLKALETRVKLMFPNKFVFNNINVDKDSRTLNYKDQFVTLTVIEYNILEALMQDKQVSRDRLTLFLKENNPRLIDTHIKNLRNKLSNFPIRINTVRGYGYALEKL